MINLIYMSEKKRSFIKHSFYTNMHINSLHLKINLSVNYIKNKRICQ